MVRKNTCTLSFRQNHNIHLFNSCFQGETFCDKLIFTIAWFNSMLFCCVIGTIISYYGLCISRSGVPIQFTHAFGHLRTLRAAFLLHFCEPIAAMHFSISLLQRENLQPCIHSIEQSRCVCYFHVVFSDALNSLC